MQHEEPRQLCLRYKTTASTHQLCQDKTTASTTQQKNEIYILLLIIFYNPRRFKHFIVMYSKVLQLGHPRFTRVLSLIWLIGTGLLFWNCLKSTLNPFFSALLFLRRCSVEGIDPILFLIHRTSQRLPSICVFFFPSICSCLLWLGGLI